MGIFDSMLSEFGGDLNAASIAEKLGIPADKVEQAIAALGIAHSQPGDTIETAAASSGLSQQHISQVVDQLGGDGALGKLSGMLGKGKSNPLTDRLSDIFGG
jgi:hypothetical protein